MAKMPLAEHDNVVKTTIPAKIPTETAGFESAWKSAVRED
jgi:hypothetical protein